MSQIITVLTGTVLNNTYKDVASSRSFEDEKYSFFQKVATDCSFQQTLIQFILNYCYSFSQKTMPLFV